MRNLEISIPHRLSRAEARKRVEGLLPQVQSQLGALGRLEERWDGDVMRFNGSVMGSAVSGQVYVEDETVRVEMELPWALAMLAGGVKQTIENEGRKLLESR